MYPRDSKDERRWSTVAIRLLVNTISHPIEYAKVLIQIGYEPIEPRPTVTLFGKPALALPNIFQYVRYIKSVDGFTGCYRGLAPKVCAYTLGSIVTKKVSESFLFTEVFPEPIVDKEIDIDELPDDKRDALYIWAFVKDVVSRVAGILASHPLDVITLRIMAQFVGGETKYNGIIQSIAEVYRTSGIAGFYSGIVPRLIANVATLGLVSASTYYLNKYWIEDPEGRTYTSTAMTFLASTFTYPFLVVYHCMAVNNCGLAAGLPPNCPIYPSWTHCWSYLSDLGQIKRGSSVLWRYYTGPQMIIDGKCIKLPVEKAKLNFFSKSKFIM